MCLISACEEIERLAVQMEIERIAPQRECKRCTPDEKCVWHRQFFNQGESNEAVPSR